MLHGYRALDLTDGEAQLCGRILADLGIDVIRVERPGGDPSRHTAPFYGDQRHPEKGLWWFVLNANKRGITVNLESKDGRGLFRRLVSGADFVIESYPPGYMTKLGLDYTALRSVNPRIIVTSITPFGQTGPYRDFKASELVLMALGTGMFATGDADRPPVAPSYPLASIASAIHAVTATMIAHYYRLQSGEGQYVDVSAQAGVPWFTGNIGPWWQTEKKEMRRTGPAMARRPDLSIRFIWPCRDGYVLFQFFGGVVGSRSNKAMARWLAEEGTGDEYFNTIDWDRLDLYQVSQAVIDRLEKPVAAFLLGRSKQELVQEATKRGILLGYVDNMKDMMQNPQLTGTGFWKEIAHPELNTSLTYPGLFVRSSVTQSGIRHRAPLIGEHSEQLYGEIGISREQLGLLKQSGVI